MGDLGISARGGAAAAGFFIRSGSHIGERGGAAAAGFFIRSGVFVGTMRGGKSAKKEEGDDSGEEDLGGLSDCDSDDSDASAASDSDTKPKRLVLYVWDYLSCLSVCY